MKINIKMHVTTTTTILWSSVQRQSKVLLTASSPPVAQWVDAVSCTVHTAQVDQHYLRNELRSRHCTRCKSVGSDRNTKYSYFSLKRQTIVTSHLGSRRQPEAQLQGLQVHTNVGSKTFNPMRIFKTHPLTYHFQSILNVENFFANVTSLLVHVQILFCETRVTERLRRLHEIIASILANQCHKRN